MTEGKMLFLSNGRVVIFCDASAMPVAKNWDNTLFLHIRYARSCGVRKVAVDGKSMSTEKGIKTEPWMLKEL